MLCRVSVEDKTDHLTLRNLFNTPLFPCHEPHRPHTPATRFIQFHLRWSLRIRTVTLHSVLVPWKLGLEILSAANLLKHLLQPNWFFYEEKRGRETTALPDTRSNWDTECAVAVILIKSIQNKADWKMIWWVWLNYRKVRISLNFTVGSWYPISLGDWWQYGREAWNNMCCVSVHKYYHCDIWSVTTCTNTLVHASTIWFQHALWTITDQLVALIKASPSIIETINEFDYEKKANKWHNS